MRIIAPIAKNPASKAKFAKKNTYFFGQRFYTLYKQKFSNLRPLLGYMAVYIPATPGHFRSLGHLVTQSFHHWSLQSLLCLLVTREWPAEIWVREVTRSDQVTEWPSNQVTKWLSDRETEWPSDIVNKWPSDIVIEWPGDRATKWPRDWMTGSDLKKSDQHVSKHFYTLTMYE